MSQQTFPNGQTLISSAQTPDTFATFFQALIAQVFGFDTTDPTQQTAAYSTVRIGWPQDGQPAWLISEDVCILTATLVDDPYARARDGLNSPNDDLSLTQRMSFTQVWELHLTLYGPNCADLARLILSTVTLDWLRDAIATKNIYLVAAPFRPRYVPENFDGRWWKRADVQLRYNELVNESIITPTAAGVDVTLITDTGAATEFVIGTV